MIFVSTLTVLHAKTSLYTILIKPGKYRQNLTKVSRRTQNFVLNFCVFHVQTQRRININWCSAEICTDSCCLFCTSNII